MPKSETQHIPAISPQAFSSKEGDIDLLELVQNIWKGKLWVMFFAVLGAALSIGYALKQPNIYRSDILAVSASENSKVGGIAGQLGGLAGLAGISLGGGDADKLTIALETLKSRSFLMKFISKYELSIPLLAVTGWDESTNDWIYNLKKYNPQAGKWLKNFKPSELKAYKVFVGKHLSLSTNMKTGLVTLSVSSYSPEYAQRWADLLVKEINDYIRNTEIAEARKSVEFLKLQLGKTPIADMQKIFYQLIEQQIKTIMLAEVRDEYVLKVIDPAIIPEEKSSPKRAVIVALGVFIGLFIGLMFALINGYRKR